MNSLKNQSSELLTISLNNLVKSKNAEAFILTLEKYLELRRTNRNLYIKNMKEIFSMIQKNKRKYSIMYPIKKTFFPFNKYMRY
ncbi:hypothetical protein BN000_02937 [Neobacillus massiliamazoniensis]|uniref:Uncharacterized protein n=1 Tax=Neobacillus massiliamazoniensis TaxID=1499688 RepID=A0A0U1NYU1_9BACI|nr:hypothetical protein BN000_02937 [Neobacillus massiliamazoniensis]